MKAGAADRPTQWPNVSVLSAILSIERRTESSRTFPEPDQDW